MLRRTMAPKLHLGALLFAGFAWASAPSGPWDSFNYAPKSRTVTPVAVKEIHGIVSHANALASQGSATLSGNGSWIALDFGIEVNLPFGQLFCDLSSETKGNRLAGSFR